MKKYILLLTGLLIFQFCYSQCDFSKAFINSETTFFCINSSDGYQFSVNNITDENLIYKWKINQEKITIDDDTAAEIMLFPHQVIEGVDTLTVEISSTNCPQATSLSYFIKWNDIPDVSSAYIDFNPVCINSTEDQIFELKNIKGKVNDYGYNWHGIHEIQPIIFTSTTNPLQVNITSLTIKPSDLFTSVQIIVSASNECGKSDDVTDILQIDNLPSQAIVSKDTLQVCQGKTVFLTGNTPTIGHGKWNIINTYHTNTDLKNINDGNTELYVLNENDPFIAEWVISNGACPSSSATQVAERINCVVKGNKEDINVQTTLFPNPFHNTINLSTTKPIEKIEIRNAIGNLLEEYSTPNQNVQLGENLESGTYFILLYTPQEVFVEKVIKK